MIITTTNKAENDDKEENDDYAEKKNTRGILTGHI